MPEIAVDTQQPLRVVLDAAERRYLEDLMTEVGGSKYAAARRAGISYNKLARRLDYHRIAPRYVGGGAG